MDTLDFKNFLGLVYRYVNYYTGVKVFGNDIVDIYTLRGATDDLCYWDMSNNLTDDERYSSLLSSETISALKLFFEAMKEFADKNDFESEKLFCHPEFIKIKVLAIGTVELMKKDFINHQIPFYEPSFIEYHKCE